MLTLDQYKLMTWQFKGSHVDVPRLWKELLELGCVILFEGRYVRTQSGDAAMRAFEVAHPEVPRTNIRFSN